MRKRVGLVPIAVGAAAVSVWVALPAAGSPSRADDTHRLRLVATVTEVAQIDGGARGPSLGDEIVFSGELLRGGRAVGHQGATCTTVSVQRHEAQCVATYSFRRGQVTAQTLVVLGSATAYDAAVTGGTGRYTGAEGVVHVRPATATNPNGVLTFELTR